MEKRIIIGRGTDCDITIPDETDNVSRHHLVISFNIFGKMKISDTSSNGTFINDNRMLKGSSVPVTRNDKIRLGAQWELDWNLVIDPFCKIRKAIIACLVAVVLALVGWGIYCAVSPKADDSTKIIIPKAETNSTDEQWNGDSTKHVVPIDERISVGNVHVSSLAQMQERENRQETFAISRREQMERQTGNTQMTTQKKCRTITKTNRQARI